MQEHFNGSCVAEGPQRAAQAERTRQLCTCVCSVACAAQHLLCQDNQACPQHTHNTRTHTPTRTHTRTLTATSVPYHLPAYTTPKEPRPSRCASFRPSTKPVLPELMLRAEPVGQRQWEHCQAFFMLAAMPSVSKAEGVTFGKDAFRGEGAVACCDCTEPCAKPVTGSTEGHGPGTEHHSVVVS
eukprot:scaffold115681_cov22-Tisochrysis_lutea.AAC.4